MVTATSRDGIKRKLIYSETILMANKEDDLSFFVKDDQLDFEMTFNFKFSDSGEKLKSTGTGNIYQKFLNITLHQWNVPTGTEIIDPLEIVLSNGKKIWIKFRSSADKSTVFRDFDLTIWGEL